MTVNIANPAGRLHALLSEYAAVTSTKYGAVELTVHGVWASVLAVEEDEVTRELARALSIVADLERAVDRYGDDAQRSVIDHWSGEWVEPFFSTGIRWDAPSTKVRVDQSALTALEALSSYLSRVAPEAESVPDEDTLAELRRSIREAVDALGNANDLHNDVRLALTEHLQELDESLTYLRYGGPKQVAAALKRLRCEVASEAEEVQKSPAVGVVKQVFVKTWVAFALGGPATEKALEAWTNVVGMLGG